MFIRIVTIFILTLSLIGCATNPVTGRSQFLLISEDQAISASSDAYVKMLAPLDEKGKIDADAEMTARVHRITALLIAQAIQFRPETKDWDWRVKVIDDPETVNAFCMAGGKMAIYSGLILKLDATDDEIAQVMGHEIAHALSAHTAEQMSIALATNLAVTAFAVTRDEPGVALAGASLAAALAIKLPNSRTAESESDEIGILLAARAGFDPNAAVSLWQKMAKNSGSDSEFDFFSTHPAPVKRIETLRKLVPKMMPYYQQKGDRPVYPLQSNLEFSQRTKRSVAAAYNTMEYSTTPDTTLAMLSSTP
jgi:predicted Zn-dependent protease